MNVATILKQKGGGVFTTTSEKSLLDIAKLLAQHGIGASSSWETTTISWASCRSAISCGQSAEAAPKS
jgi:hypothetical protein